MSSPAFRLLALVVLAGSLAYASVEGYAFVRNGFRWTPGALSEACVQEYRQDGTLFFGGNAISVEVADTQAARERGLSGRACIQAGQGMLFTFDEAAIHPFWMNEMRFPIDIIWIRNGVVVEVAADLPPPSETFWVPATHQPSEPADMVLELKAGEAARLGLSPGTPIDIIAYD